MDVVRWIQLTFSTRYSSQPTPTAQPNVLAGGYNQQRHQMCCQVNHNLPHLTFPTLPTEDGRAAGALELDDRDHGAKDERLACRSLTHDSQNRGADENRVEYDAGDGRPVVAGARQPRSRRER